MILNHSIIKYFNYSNIRDLYIKNDIIYDKINISILKILRLPIKQFILSDKTYQLIIRETNNNLLIDIDIDLELYYKNKLNLDSRILELIKKNEISFVNIKTHLFLKENILYSDGFYINIDSGVLQKKLATNDLINLKIDGCIINGFKQLHIFKKFISKKKCLIINTNKLLNKQLEIVFEKCIFYTPKLNDILCKIKWDCIINFGRFTGTPDPKLNIDNFIYKHHILVVENLNYITITIKHFLGETLSNQICLENGHNINLIRKFIYNNNQVKTLKRRQLLLSKYESEFMIGVPDSKLNVFYSFPGNFIYNKFVSKRKFKKIYDNANYECTICLEKIKMNNISLTECKHIYCRKCLMKTLEVSNKCPLCRQKIRKNSLTFVSNFKYENDTINFILNRVKLNKKLIICSTFNNTLENLKFHLDGCKLQFINISNLNMSQMSKYDEIIFTDNAHYHFDFILDIFAENNPTINLILLSYKSVSYIK